MKKFEHRYVLARFGLQDHNRGSRKSTKERKNRTKKIRGKKKKKST